MVMSQSRTGRQKFYDVFSHFYDLFIRLHSRNYRDETRRFLVDSTRLEDKAQPRVLDVCCGTGSVVLSFAERFPDILAIGYDLSLGMLRKAKRKDSSDKVVFVRGDAARLSFGDDVFDVVCCSHALYELEGRVRRDALLEMKRVVKPGGSVLIMEHTVPRRLFVRMLFYLRLRTLSSSDSREFIKQGLAPFEEIFADVALSHTGSGKSKLITCRKS